MIDAILTNTILPRVSEEYLARIVAGRQLGAITLGFRNGDFSFDLA
jgi:type VI secretion system protein VasG